MRLFMSEHTYCQRGDNIDELLTIKVDDEGAGPYLVIKTERWSMERSDVAALAAKLAKLLDAVERQEEA